MHANIDVCRIHAHVHVCVHVRVGIHEGGYIYYSLLQAPGAIIPYVSFQWNSLLSLYLSTCRTGHNKTESKFPSCHQVALNTTQNTEYWKKDWTKKREKNHTISTVKPTCTRALKFICTHIRIRTLTG